MSDRVLLFDAKGRRVASVRGDLMYFSCQASRHFLRAFGGAIAINVEVLNDGLAAGARRIEVTDSESGRIYAATFDDFRTRGIRFDYGHGPQVALSLEYWRMIEPAARPVQMALEGWGA